MKTVNATERAVPQGSEERTLYLAATELAQQVRLLRMAIGGLYEASQQSEVGLADIQPVHVLASKVMTLADDVEDQAVNLKFKAEAAQAA